MAIYISKSQGKNGSGTYNAGGTIAFAPVTPFENEIIEVAPVVTPEVKVEPKKQEIKTEPKKEEKVKDEPKFEEEK